MCHIIAFGTFKSSAVDAEHGMMRKQLNILEDTK